MEKDMGTFQVLVNDELYGFDGGRTRTSTGWIVVGTAGVAVGTYLGNVPLVLAGTLVAGAGSVMSNMGY